MIVSNNPSHSYTTCQCAEHLNIYYLIRFLQFCEAAAMIRFILQMGRCSFQGIKWLAYGHWIQLEIKLSFGSLVHRCSLCSHKPTHVGKLGSERLIAIRSFCQSRQQSASEQWTHRNRRSSLLENTDGVGRFYHSSEGPHKSFKWPD